MLREAGRWGLTSLPHPSYPPHPTTEMKYWITYCNSVCIPISVPLHPKPIISPHMHLSFVLRPLLTFPCGPCPISHFRIPCLPLLYNVPYDIFILCSLQLHPCITPLYPMLNILYRIPCISQFNQWPSLLYPILTIVSHSLYFILLYFILYTMPFSTVTHVPHRLNLMYLYLSFLYLHFPASSLVLSHFCIHVPH
jgi:hypothetical protein